MPFAQIVAFSRAATQRQVIEHPNLTQRIHELS